MSSESKLIQGISQLSSQHRPSAVSIGNYDGVHLGHQHVVETLLKKSQELGVPSTVITFEPLAKEFFSPTPVMRLTSLQQRAEQLFELGVEQVLSIDFTQDFADNSPQDFIQKVLLDGLGVEYVCVGDDFKFGKDRTGDFRILHQAGEQQGFAVEAHQTFELGGERVSSGRVRLALMDSNFELAAQLLGRPYSLRGPVSVGEQLGRTLNFPTANIVLGDYVLAVSGVFGVRCRLNKGETLIDGVANIGRRPTVDGKQNRLEVHLFDFDEDIYGQILDVQLMHKIRDEKKFNGIDELQAQIQKDVAIAKEKLK